MYLLAGGQQFPLNLIDLIFRHPNRRSRRPTLGIAVLSDDNVAASEIFKVVGERTQGADDSIRIPPGLVFNALTLDCAVAQQILYVDRQGRHIQAPGERVPANAGKIARAYDVFDKLENYSFTESA
ncbi:hypothetical protein RugamoR1_18880 [Rugamonas sp. R1(2021)]